MIIQEINNIDFSKWLCRASCAGKIMTNPRGKTNAEKYIEAVDKLNAATASYSTTVNKETKTAKNLLVKIEKLEVEISQLELIKDKPTLSETCKTFLIEQYVEAVFGVRKEFDARQTRKGIMVEDDAIDLLSELHGKLYVKNQTHFKNDFVKGTPDILHKTTVIDIKSSYDIFTFYNTKIDDLDSSYHAQLQCYMALASKENARLSYCLINMPNEIFEIEKRKMDYNFAGTDEEKAIAYEKLMNRFKYDHIPSNLKVHEFVFEKDEKFINELYKRIEVCREFLQDFATKDDAIVQISKYLKELSAPVENIDEAINLLIN